MIPSHAWLEDAACRGADTSLFYPERGESSVPARMVCFECPVRAECLEVGLGEKFGMFGGLTPHERDQLARGKAS